MNEIQIFKNESFGEVRVTEVNNEVWFVGKDIATILGYAKPTDAIIDHVDEEDRKTLTFKAFAETEKASLWQGNDYSDKTLINESGVYSLILASKLPSAKQFKRWVTSDVLPSIRKTGVYALPKSYADALRELACKVEENERLALENTTMKPKAEYYDALVDRKCLLNFTDTAKELKIGRTALINILLENKWIYRNNGKDLRPYAKYVEKGYFEMKEFHNENRSNTQTLITVDGRDVIMNKLLTVKIK